MKCAGGGGGGGLIYEYMTLPLPALKGALIEMGGGGGAKNLYSMTITKQFGNVFVTINVPIL
jgi:hypothetical protein